MDIADGNGKCIESGYAVAQPGHLHWTYTAQNANLHLNGTAIAAHAFDHPRKTGSMEIIL